MMIYALNEAGQLVITFLIIILLCLLSFLLLRSFIKVVKSEKEDKETGSSDGLITKKQLIGAIDQFIERYRQNYNMTLFLFELEDFSSLKNVFGLRQMERVSKNILSSIQVLLPRNALLADYDDNQYAVLLRGKISKSKLESLAQDIIDLIQKPIAIPTEDGGNIEVKAFLGGAIYPENGNKTVELLRNTEMALYMATKGSDKRYVMFENETKQTESENLKYYREIKEAMRNKEFTLYYQPIVDCQTEKVISFEALIRWNHPTLGVLSPAKFLNIMEMSGDVTWIGRWGIETICKQLLEWKKSNPEYDFMVSFNLSPKQLLDPQISVDFQTIVKRYRINPANICLEIVQFAMFEKYSIISENIQKLSKGGFSMAIDDFSLEANSLSRLTNLPINMIKFDRDFSSQANGNYIMKKILDTIVDLSKEEGNEKILVAESVEDKEMLQAIEKLGVYCAQGYMFSKPISSKDVIPYLKSAIWKVKLHEDVVNDLKEDEPYFKKNSK